MDKQKKQIVILVAVLVLGGAVLAFLYRDKIFGKPPATDPAAAQPATDPNAAAGQPAAGTPAGQPAPAAPAKDLPKPELKLPADVNFTIDYKRMRDPLLVLDPDFAYSGQQSEVAALKAKWIVRGIAIVGEETVKVYKKNADGTENPVPDQTVVVIRACFFDANPRFYRVGDRLEDTHFTVSAIHFEPDGAYVEVEGDLGIKVKLQMVTNDRYK